MLVVQILPWTRFFFVMSTCSLQLDWQRSNEIKHDIHPRLKVHRERKIILTIAAKCVLRSAH